MPLGQDIPAPCRLTMLRGGAEVEGNFSVYDSSIRRMFSQKPCHLYHSPLFLSTIDCRKWGLSSLTNFVGDDYSHFYTAFGHLWTIMHGDILLWGLLASCIMSAKRNMNIPDDLSFFGATLSYQHSTLFDSSVLRFVAWARRSAYRHICDFAIDSRRQFSRLEGPANPLLPSLM